MIKYFCDKCGIEVSASEAAHSLDMVGKVLCSEHTREHTDKKYEWKYEKENPLSDEAIICPCCGKESGYTKRGVMFLVIYHDLLCQYCHGVVIAATRIICQI